MKELTVEATVCVAGGDGAPAREEGPVPLPPGLLMDWPPIAWLPLQAPDGHSTL
jgi:hypothetical protein